MALTKTSNPTFRSSIYNNLGAHAITGETMTINGTIHRTGILLLCILGSAFFVWSQYYSHPDSELVGPAMIGGVIGGLIFGLITCFKMAWAPITAPIYALFEGLFLGGLSATLEASYPGIAIQAVGLTFGTCFCLLIAYRAGVIRATEKFKFGVIAATGGICLVYILDMILSLFGVRVPGIFGSGPIGIIFSLVVVTIAALNLILDFSFIEEGAQRGAPKYMEWYSAFGLMVTLVWLYVEILRLLTKLRDRR